MARIRAGRLPRLQALQTNGHLPCRKPHPRVHGFHAIGTLQDDCFLVRGISAFPSERLSLCRGFLQLWARIITDEQRGIISLGDNSYVFRSREPQKAIEKKVSPERLNLGPEGRAPLSSLFKYSPNSSLSMPSCLRNNPETV